MKILEIIFSLSSGGGERFVVDLSNELSNKGNDVTLMTIKDDKINPEHRLFYRSELSESVRYENLGIKGGNVLHAVWCLYKAIVNISPDAVHMHLEGAPKFCILAILLLHKRIRFYQTIHNDMKFYNDMFYRLFFRTCGKIKIIKFIALSQTNYSDLKRMHPYVDAKCIVNGRAPMLPTANFEEVKKELDAFRKGSGTPLVLHIARCNEQKNQELLIDAFNKLRDDGEDAQLIIIGAGFDSELGRKILGKAGDNIHYLGTRKNISDYMLNVDLFCLSSKFEGMPITLLEASLAGVPSFSTPVCGAVDLIIQDKNGFISKDFTLNEYVATAKKALKNIKRLKVNAKTMIDNSPYTIKKCAEEYSKFFIELN